MPDLSKDEVTVLTIASHGESMMPIGRWEKPVQRLVSLGLLHSHDKFNNVITDEGRRALDNDDKETTQAILVAAKKVSKGQADIQRSIDKCAVTLAESAKRSRDITGDDLAMAARRWAEVILKRALELLEDE